MLQNYKESTTITAQSIVTIPENGQDKQVQAAYMTANLDGEGGVNITKVINNKEAYAANKTTVRADFTEFENKVYAAEDEGETE